MMSRLVLVPFLWLLHLKKVDEFITFWYIYNSLAFRYANKLHFTLGSISLLHFTNSNLHEKEGENNKDTEKYNSEANFFSRLCYSLVKLPCCIRSTFIVSFIMVYTCMYVRVFLYTTHYIFFFECFPLFLMNRTTWQILQLVAISPNTLTCLSVMFYVTWFQRITAMYGD